MFRGRLFAGRLYAGQLFGGAVIDVDKPFQPGQLRQGRADDDDVLRSAIEKWEAIEAINAADVVRPQPAPTEPEGRATTPQAVFSEATPQQVAAQIAMPGATRSRTVLATPAAMADMALPITLAKQDAARKAALRGDEEALLLILLAAADE
jgi:hypothetical protein